MPEGKTISELITLLEEAKEEHGDLPVYTYSHHHLCNEPVTGLYFEEKPVDGNNYEWIKDMSGITLTR